MCEAGQGVTQDLSEAVRWYRQAAAHGSEAAEARLREPLIELTGRAALDGDAEARTWQAATGLPIRQR